METDGDLVSFHDDGHFTPSVRIAQHQLHFFLVLKDIVIQHLLALLGERLPGRRCEWSGIFTENLNRLGHGDYSFHQIMEWFRAPAAPI